MKNNKKLVFSGAAFYVLAFQIASLLPLPLMLFASDSSFVLSKKGILQFLFETGISSLPRAEALGLSTLYRVTSGEIWVYFAVALAALVLGLAAKKLFPREGKSVAARIVFAALVAADLTVRLIPFSFNRVFDTVPNAIGFVVRLASLAALVYDIVKIKREK